MRPILLLFALAAAAPAQDYGTNYRMKIPVGGENRKGVLFLPNNIKKGEALPLVVAIPDTRGKAYLEIGQFQQPADEKRFALISVDVTTSGAKGWHPKDQLEMQRDMEAVTEGIKLAFEKAKSVGVELDPSATTITGFSGGTYLTLWLGIRRPDLFLGVCGRACVFHKATVEFGKLERTKPNKSQAIFLYHGELDNPRVKKETQLARKLLKEKGWTNVKFKIVPKMSHESKPEVFLEWHGKLIKETAKGREASRKIRIEVDKLRPDVKAGKSAAYGKLVKLVEREQKAGIAGGANVLLGEVTAAAQKHWDMAADLEAGNQLGDAAVMYRQVAKKYNPLEIAKKARKHRALLMKSDAYKAEEMLIKAKALLDKDKKDRAFTLLEKIVDKYGETVAAEEAKALLQG